MWHRLQLAMDTPLGIVLWTLVGLFFLLAFVYAILVVRQSNRLKREKRRQLYKR